MFKQVNRISPDRGYLQSAYQSVRDAGGVCVADEVQVGFGRFGDSLARTGGEGFGDKTVP